MQKPFTLHMASPANRVTPADRVTPANRAILLDIPHAGRHYPAIFGLCAQAEQNWLMEDILLDTLWQAAPQMGASLLTMQLGRAIADVNAALSQTTRLFRHPPRDKQEATLRLDYAYHPYHAALAQEITRLKAAHGPVLHLNLHSFGRTQANGEYYPHAADIELGTRHGQTASDSTLKLMADFWRQRGYRVACNQIFSGGEIIRRHGQPSANIESVQIEFARALYFDPILARPHDGATRLQKDCEDFLQMLTMAPQPNMPPANRGRKAIAKPEAKP